MTNRLTVRKLKAWAAKNHDLAIAALKARAFAEVERERVDAYIAPIFATYGFVDGDGTPISAASKLYLCDDDEPVNAFYLACDIAHGDRGFTGVIGECPALIAEDLQRKAENALLESMAAFVGVSGFCTSLEMRAKALDLAIATCTARG